MHNLYFNLLSQFSYVGLFLVLIAAGLGIPLPEDIPLLASGWLVHQGGAHLYGMMAVGLIGVMVGDSLLFFMGRRYGDHIVDHPWLRRFAKPWLLERARTLYGRYGEVILFAARFMPGLRSVLFLTAGVFRVPYWKFFIIDGFAASISVPVWVWAGYKFSEKIEAILGGARIATFVIVGLLLTGLIIWIIYEYRHNLTAHEPIAPKDSTPDLSGLVMPSDSALNSSAEADHVNSNLSVVKGNEAPRTDAQPAARGVPPSLISGNLN